jgi:hypothetical protein
VRITKLLGRLPDWRGWGILRALTRHARTQVQDDVATIVRRVMGDVLDWLRLTPNAVV